MMKYAKNYERCCIERPGALHRWFMGLLSRKAQAIGQKDHKSWSLKYLIDTYFPDKTGLRILDCGAWNGWFLSYAIPAIVQRVALDFDDYYAAEMRRDGIEFVLADMEKGHFPFRRNTFDLLVMTSTLEHLGCPEHVAGEILRELKPGGFVFITVPNVLSYNFRFWDDATHKHPFSPASLRHLFEGRDMETIELCSYRHNFFIAGNLLPKPIHRFLMRFHGMAIMYVGRKPPP